MMMVLPCSAALLPVVGSTVLLDGIEGESGRDLMIHVSLPSLHDHRLAFIFSGL